MLWNIKMSKELLKHSILGVCEDERVEAGLQYLTLMGSRAYGVATEESDYDVYGFFIPPMELLYPYLGGEIEGFGEKVDRIPQWRQDNIVNKDAYGDILEIDCTVFNITRYFTFLMDNNPNVLESIYTDEEDIIYQSDIAKNIRENREIFLHKGLITKFMGYAMSQLKALSKNREGSRVSLIKKYGYDTKNAYCLLRLLEECRQLLTIGEIQIKKMSADLVHVRNGKWQLDEVLKLAEEYKTEIEFREKYNSLPEEPRYQDIRVLLLKSINDYHMVKIG